MDSHGNIHVLLTYVSFTYTADVRWLWQIDVPSVFVAVGAAPSQTRENMDTGAPVSLLR